jgi:PST family polysaccharide transporter
VTLISFITMPLMVVLFVCADQVIHLLLGGKWSGAAGIFKVLSITAFIQPAASTVGLVVVSLGQSRRYLIGGIGGGILAVLSFVAGLPW